MTDITSENMTPPIIPLANEAMSRKPLTRWQAFAWHFGISLLIFFVLLFLLTKVWYPGFFFDTDGGWEGLRILIGVDLVLGPALTLIVYRPFKRGLILDLTLIGLAQLICLLIGIYIVHSERPLALVFVDDQFISVSQGSFDFAGTDSAALKTFTGKYPKQIYINMPKDKKIRKDMRRAQTHQGPLHARTTLFLPYDDHAKEAVNEGGFSLDEYRKNRPEKSKDVDAWLAKQKFDESKIVWVPYTARYQNSFIILDRQTGKILGHTPRQFAE